MKWYYAEKGKQMGPIEEAEFDGLVSAGTIQDGTLVWHEGMSAWRPFSAMRGGSPTAALAAPLGVARYGGFWIRFLARLIDGVLLAVMNGILTLPLAILLGLGSMRGGARTLLPIMFGVRLAALFLSIVIGVVYEVYFVSTRGATPGKMALGLKIVRDDGSPVPAGLALGRYFAQWISGLTLMIGYIMAAFDAQKRALHDHICGTRVLRT